MVDRKVTTSILDQKKGWPSLFLDDIVLGVTQPKTRVHYSSFMLLYACLFSTTTIFCWSSFISENFVNGGWRGFVNFQVERWKGLIRRGGPVAKAVCCLQKHLMCLGNTKVISNVPMQKQNSLSLSRECLILQYSSNRIMRLRWYNMIIVPMYLAIFMPL